MKFEKLIVVVVYNNIKYIIITTISCVVLLTMQQSFDISHFEVYRIDKLSSSFCFNLPIAASIALHQNQYISLTHI